MEKTKKYTPAALKKQIGGTTYVVRVHFNEDAKETMEGKIKRMLENEVKVSQNTLLFSFETNFNKNYL